MKSILMVTSLVAAMGLCASDAADFGFSPDATGRANTAALQQAFDAGGTVRVTKPGRYKIADTVFIGDNTSLICDSGVFFVKSDEGKKFAQVILNKGALTKTWNHNIEITGLHIVVNGMDHNDWKVFGLRGHLAFFYAKDVRINRFRCLDLGRAQYCIHVCTFEDLIVDDVRIFGWKDGVHLGRGKRFTIRNGVFDTGDDPIALNAHDYSTGNPELGWIEDGVVENCHDLDNPSRRVGYFCRILAGAWCDWRAGMVVQQGDSVVAGGSLYRVSMPVDGRTYVSKTRPAHKKGQQQLDGINWVWVQDEEVYACGVRNVVFRDCFLRQPRTAFSIHYDFGKYSRSQYPGAKPPKQEGIVFDNVQVLYTNNVPFLSIATPVDSVSINNCTLRNGGIRFSSNPAMAQYGYGRTQIQVNGCRFYAGRDWPFISNPIADKPIDLKTSGSQWCNPAFSARVSETGVWSVDSDLPGLQTQAALWDLMRDKPSETRGTPRFLADGRVVLDEASAFAVPASAFPDQKNFTVKVTVKFPPLNTKSSCASIVAKEGTSDSGFGFGIFRNVYHEGYRARVNLMYATANIYAGGKGRSDAEKPMAFTIVAREGIVSFYRDDVPGAKVFATPIPCDAPMWVGLDRKNFGDLEVLDLKVYGKDFEYRSPREKLDPKKELYGVRVGKGWSLGVPQETDPKRPRVLIYGDSISMGYCPILRNALGDKVYVEHWCHFVSGMGFKPELFARAAASSKLSVIVFNNGLHSTHWTQERFSDEQVAESYRTMVKGFRAGAPQATLFYLNTTQVSDGQTPRGLDPRNDVVVRLNKIAADVMKEEGVEVIDIYSILAPHLDKMSTDRFHWNRFGYETIAEIVEKKIQTVLNEIKIHKN